MQGFIDDNLISKRLLCWEQIKMILGKSNAQSSQGENVECHTCSVTNFPAPGSPPALGLLTEAGTSSERKQCLSTLQTGKSLKHAWA